MNNNILIVALFCGLNFFAQNKEIKLNSPSKNLVVKVLNDTEGLKLALINSKKEIIELDMKGFVFEEELDFKNFEVTKTNKSSENETWNPVYGERNTITNKYKEIVLTLTNKNNSKNVVKLVCRAYDEGIAFRYLFDADFYKNRVDLEELTSFNFKHDNEAWITNHAQGLYKKGKISTITKGVERPLVI